MTPIEQIKAAIAQGSLDALARVAAEVGVPAAVSERDAKFKRQALHWAAKANRPDMIQWLAAHGADLEGADMDGTRPLHVAAMNGLPEACSALLALGAKPDSKRADGKTPYLFAQSQSSRGPEFSRAAAMLLKAGADALARDAEGKTADEHGAEVVLAAGKAATPSAVDLSRLNLENSPLAAALGQEMDRMSSQGAPDPFAAPAPAEPKTSLSQGGADGGGPKMPREEAIKKLRELGFDLLGAQDGAPPLTGREAEADDVANLLDKGKNVMLVGKPGVGKRSLARAVAERLAARGKIVMGVPSSSFRGNKYAGSVNENIQKWLGPALSLGDELALFINDAHQLSTGKTSSDTTDTPLQILREQLDVRKDHHLTLLCATTPAEVASLAEDEAFMRLFSRKDVKQMDAAQTLSAMTSPAGARALLADHPGADLADLARLAETATTLCEKYLFNQSFPAKAFEFASRALAEKGPKAWDEKGLGDLFCKAYSVPREIAEGRLSADSPFYQLEAGLKKKLIGQDGPISDIAEAVSSQVVLANPTSHRPVSMLFAGPTGVGKTEAAETTAKILGLPMLSFPMGECKTGQDVGEMRAKLADFCSKNYAGVILVDEIEKGHPGAHDLLLNLFDKGRVGSGDDAVDCGFMICIATTNVGAREAVSIKQSLRSMEGGDPRIHDSWIREKMIEAGFRPEFINRIELASDFNDITRADALTIAKMMFASQAKGLADTRGITLTVDESVAKEHAADVFDADYGARGIRRCVESTLKRIVSDRSIALAIGPGSTITATSVDGAIRASATPAGGAAVSANVRDKDETRDKLRLEHAMKSLAHFGAAVDSAARQIPGERPRAAGPRG